MHKQIVWNMSEAMQCHPCHCWQCKLHWCLSA